MGIWLAIRLLDGRVKQSPHGGASEACDELVREACWMTSAEVAHVLDWARKNSSEEARLLLPVMVSVQQQRRERAPLQVAN
jgi:hypothetical protein